MKFSRACLGTYCSIEVRDSDFFLGDGSIEKAFGIIEDFEKKYSRFSQNNILTTLNTQKELVIDKELRFLLEFGIKLGDISEGYFDITILPYLENNGYGITKKYIKENIGYKNIVLSEQKVFLKNDIYVEFGSYGKGYLLDKVGYYLSKKYKNFVLDFGGDIKVYGSQDIHLENPAQKNSYYGKLNIQDAVLASSNGSKRKFGDNSHHLIDIKTGKSHDKIHTVFCYHNKGMFADGYATLFSVSPKEVSKKVMRKTRGLEAFIIYSDGSELRSGRFLNI